MPDIQDLLATEIGGFSLGNLLAALVIFLVSLLVIKLLMKAIKKPWSAPSSSGRYAASSSPALVCCSGCSSP